MNRYMNNSQGRVEKKKLWSNKKNFDLRLSCVGIIKDESAENL
jgi:hypothetical protein